MATEVESLNPRVEVELQNNQILECFQILAKLSKRSTNVRAALKIGTLRDTLQDQACRVEQKRRALMHRYGEKDDDGEVIVENNQIDVPDELEDEAEKEFDDLFSGTRSYEIEPLLPEDLEFEYVECSDCEKEIRGEFSLTGEQATTLKEAGLLKV